MVAQTRRDSLIASPSAMMLSVVFSIMLAELGPMVLPYSQFSRTKGRNRVLPIRMPDPFGCFLDELVFFHRSWFVLLLAAGHGDHAGAGQFADAVGPGQFDEGLQLVLGA